MVFDKIDEHTNIHCSLCFLHYTDDLNWILFTTANKKTHIIIL